tara:strand:+ start:684 stop:1100 length:417 start_codon:yes stop_codon:yes gene_type:complete
MPNSIKWIVFVTGWMTFRAIGSSLFLFWNITGHERGAPSEWVLALVGDFIIGTTALFLVYFILKKPSYLIWGLLLFWNILGVVDLFGAITTSLQVPYGPLPEIGLTNLGVRFVLILNTLLQISCIFLLFKDSVRNYFV